MSVVSLEWDLTLGDQLPRLLFDLHSPREYNPPEPGGESPIESARGVTHAVTGGAGEVVAQGFQVNPALWGKDDPLHPEAGEVESASGAFPPHQFPLEGMQRLRGKRARSPSGARLHSPVSGRSHVVRLEIEMEVRLIEPEPQLSRSADLWFDFTGFGTEHFIAGQDRVQRSRDLGGPGQDPMGTDRNASQEETFLWVVIVASTHLGMGIDIVDMWGKYVPILDTSFQLSQQY